MTLAPQTSVPVDARDARLPPPDGQAVSEGRQSGGPSQPSHRTARGGAGEGNYCDVLSQRGDESQQDAAPAPSAEEAATASILQATAASFIPPRVMATAEAAPPAACRE